MLLAAFSQYFFGISIFVSSIFLVLLVLVQRGRGGGLTGALGGAGGQSAFGTKAGDLFTRITIGVAVVWIVLCASSVYFLKSRGLPTLSGSGATGATADTSSNTNAGTGMGGLGDSGSLDAGTAPQGTDSTLGIDPANLPALDLNGSGDDGTAEGEVEAEVSSFDDENAAETDANKTSEDAGQPEETTSETEDK